MKMILTAGALTLALLVATIGAVHAKSQAPPTDETVSQPVVVGE